MTGRRAVLLIGLCFVFAVAAQAPADAATKPNIVVIGVDSDPGSVRHDSRIFTRAAAALADQLHEAGFDVFDAAGLLPKIAGRARRTDRDIVSAARAMKRPPLDIVVIFAVYADAREREYGTWIGARVAGRMLNVRTGQLLGSFEVASPRPRRAPAACARPCLLEIVGREAKILARDMGAALAEKLIWVSEPDAPLVKLTTRKPAAAPNGYALVLDGFSAEEVTSIEKHLVVFTGYNRHRPVRAGARYHEIWYETSAGSGRLYRNLKKTLEHMGVRGRVDLSDNVFTITKIGRRAQRAFRQGDW